MPKKFIKRYTPDHRTVRNHPHLRIFGCLLHDANLWHLNRRSASGAFAVGLFMAFLPVPGQMLLAAAGAILCRVNLPVSVALVWLTNPLTMPPIFYFAYLVGTWVLGQPAQGIELQLSVQWVMESLDGIWAPLLLGSVICGAVAAVLGYAGIRWLWRWRVVRHLRQRRQRHQRHRSPAATGLSLPSSRRQT